MAEEKASKNRWRSRLAKLPRLVGLVVLLVLLIGSIYLLIRLNDDVPVTYEADEDHFKYGSTGGERGYGLQFGFGVPYWIWIALPEIFPEHLPGKKAGEGYSSFGMIYEDGKDPHFDLPIGMSMRRRQGIDRVYFTCSACHTGSVRDTPEGEAQIVLGMPSNVFRFGELGLFLYNSAHDIRFRPNYFMPKIKQLAELRRKEYPTREGYRPAEFGFIDQQIFKWAGINLMREQLISLMGRLTAFIDFSTWGPGRVDTFNAPKALLGFDMTHAPEREKRGNVDFPSIWNQQFRKGMHVHWDANNCSVDERNLSAGYGTGATPATLDKEKMLRIADWIWDAEPPAFPQDRINSDLAAEGEPLYRQYCWECHGNGRPPFKTAGDDSKVGGLTPIEQVGTDRWRLDSYTPELAAAQNTLYAGFPELDDEVCRDYALNKVCDPDQPVDEFREMRQRCYPNRFSHFRKTYGYANMPLDGLWLRAPYLHNGSVPTLRDLLKPAAERPKVFKIGYDVYDYENVGFLTEPCCSGEVTEDCRPPAEGACVPDDQGWLLDTTVAANGNQGHEYAVDAGLDDHQKDALLEYMKTF